MTSRVSLVQRLSALGPWLLVLPATAVLLFILIIPVAGTLAESFSNPAGLFANYRDFFADSYNRTVMIRSFRIAFLSTLTALILGFGGAYMIANASQGLKRVLLILSVFPLLTSVVVRSFSFMAILGRNGVVNTALMKLGLISEPMEMLFTQGAVIAGLAYLFTPLMILSLVSAMENIPKDVEQAARSLGANGITAFLRVIVPLSADGLVLGATLVFTGSITAYVTPVILGGNRMLMLSTLLRQRSMMAFDEQGATVVAVVMIVTALAVNLIVRMLRPKPTAQR